MKYIPVKKNQFLRISLAGHGELIDGRSLGRPGWDVTWEDIEGMFVKPAKEEITYDSVSIWVKRTNRQN